MTFIGMVCTAGGKMSAALMLMAFPTDTCAQLLYPSKAIRFIVPSTAGANREILARLLRQKLSGACSCRIGNAAVLINPPLASRSSPPVRFDHSPLE
jgi:tripartite-type tricarboxylate transporter receptor subunit TctC